MTRVYCLLKIAPQSWHSSSPSILLSIVHAPVFPGSLHEKIHAAAVGVFVAIGFDGLYLLHKGIGQGHSVFDGIWNWVGRRYRQK